MRFKIAASLAIGAGSSLNAQAEPSAPVQSTARAIADFSTATPVAGNWIYSSANGVTEATFMSSTAQPQLTIRCTFAARRITLSKPAQVAAPFLNIWTSSQSRSLLAGFIASTARLNVDISAYDPLLDGIAFSRGRIAVSVTGQPPLVVPVWAEAARVIEDCRA